MTKNIVVVCAAVRFEYFDENGKKQQVTLSGVRHHAILQSDIYQYFKNNYRTQNREEGFLTNEYIENLHQYRFVGRIGAKTIVKDFNQKVNNNDREECSSVELFSEDLY